MPVQKFRSVETMNAAPVLRSAADGFERFLRHCARYRSMVPRTQRNGVFRFRSLEEAQLARQRDADALRVLFDPGASPPTSTR